MSKELLDDWEWDSQEDFIEHNRSPNAKYTDNVVMLYTFNTENEAHISAATLKSEGIDAYVVSSATGQMTPFAYGNVRLFVAKSQQQEATDILERMEAEKRFNTVNSSDLYSKWVVYFVVALSVLFITLGIFFFFLS